ncbi:class I SAM-dependent methyltransferase [Luteimonas aquatica]|uniref:class I SAM-dependent methyltransferase n=1 Tax=Luteimonas aquatica TaxID=450364 RepID=UPI001F590F37|nr:class I SAM-dependent methyltransferase [Luteimonas aquatica]
MKMNRCPACGGNDLKQEACAFCGFAPGRIDGFRAFAPALASSSEGFDPEHHHALAALEAGNFWFRARNLLIVTAARRYAPGMSSFLEIGCGTGFVMGAMREAFPKADCVGSELLTAGLQHAAERMPDVEFVQMDARAIPFERCFDAVGAFDVIEHIEDDRKVLSQAAQALKDGGALLVTVPQHQWLWSEQDEIAHHVRRYSRRELVERVEAAGLDVVKVTSFVTLLLPLMLLARKGKKAAAAADDPYREFRIPSWMNSLLYAAMRLELALLNLGLSLPLGGSLLLVAKKKPA